MIQRQMVVERMITVQTSPCPHCRGLGEEWSPDNVCLQCQGSKFYEEEKEIEITVPAGTLETDCAVLRNLGHIGPDLHSRGDIVIKVQITPHPVFQRNVKQSRIHLDKYDLLTEIEISVAESLCGFEHNIQHLNGQTYLIRSQNMTREGDFFEIEHAGLPDPQGHDQGHTGKLIVVCHVKNLPPLTSEQKQQLRGLLTLTTDSGYIKSQE
jgi:DnaJ-class molecular chaperone